MEGPKAPLRCLETVFTHEVPWAYGQDEEEEKDGAWKGPLCGEDDFVGGRGHNGKTGVSMPRAVI